MKNLPYQGDESIFYYLPQIQHHSTFIPIMHYNLFQFSQQNHHMIANANNIELYDISFSKANNFSKSQPDYGMSPHPHQTGIVAPNPAKKRQKNLFTKKQDEEYKPQVQEKSLITAQTFQNEKRNIMPNLIHQIYKFITSDGISKILVRKLLQSYSNPIASQKRFYYFQKLLKKKIKRYVNLNFFIRLLKPFEFIGFKTMSLEQQTIYCSIARRLTKHFLKELGICVTVSSRKIRKENRVHHFEAHRKILSAIKSQGRIEEKNLEN